MELNILNHEATYNDKIFSGSGEYSIDNEFTLPDYYPEISKVLKCRIVPRVATHSIGGQTLTVDGNILINLIYCSEENEIFGFEQTLNFSKSFDIGAECNNADIDSSVKCEYVNCRCLSERKIDIHGAVGIYVNVYKKTTIGIVSDLDGGDVVIRRGLLPATSPIGTGEKSLLIDEELELSNGQPSIRCILKCDARAVNSDCKIIGGKIAQKGELNIFILYCAEHTKGPQIYRNSIPYSQIIDIDGLHENCVASVKTKVASFEIKPRTSATGETRSFMLSAKLNFCAKASCEDDLPVVLDAYSTKFNADVKTREIAISKMQKNINNTLLCRKTIDNIGEISSVLDIWCENPKPQTRICDGALMVTGELQLCILALNALGVPQYIERTVDFEYNHPIENCNDNIKAAADVLVNNVSFTLQGNNSMEANLELYISADILCDKKVNLVTEICVDESSLKPKCTDSALVIYYAEPGEELWSIARKYNSNPQEISEINSLEDEIILCKKTLLIPIK